MPQDNELGNRPEFIATGRMRQAAGTAAIFGAFGQGSWPMFNRAVVHEVLFDPSLLDEDRIQALIHDPDLHVSNIANIKRLPRNTIIASLVRNGKNPDSGKFLWYPFFPPHMSLPIKAGEHVWVFLEHNDPKDANLDHGYWICRITESRDIDDVNYTHANRDLDQSVSPGSQGLAGMGGSSAKPGFPNGAVLKNKDDPTGYAVDPQTATIIGEKDAYEDIIQKSDAGIIHDLEPVPRFTKRPADHVIEGSNNTLIVLGTDRTGPAADTTSSKKGKRAKGKPTKDQTGKAGTIDIVVGRGQKANKQGEIDNSIGKKETDKSIDKETPNEGDPDFDTDLGRIYISMNTDADTNFNVQLKTLSDKSGPGAATVIKTDHIRMIARKSIKILVQPKFDSADSECAGVEINANGDIIFVPSDAGVIKLGGDDADIALLGLPASNAAGGQVVPGGLINSTIGSQVGIGGANGAFAKKVIMK